MPPGSAFAFSISSFTVDTPSLGLTISTFGELPRMVIGLNLVGS